MRKCANNENNWGIFNDADKKRGRIARAVELTAVANLLCSSIWLKPNLHNIVRFINAVIAILYHHKHTSVSVVCLKIISYTCFYEYICIILIACMKWLKSYELSTCFAFQHQTSLHAWPRSSATTSTKLIKMVSIKFWLSCSHYTSLFIIKW